MKIEFEINGKHVAVDCDPQKSLLRVIREDLGLTGTKYCCGSGECGACTVLFDGKPVTSCIMKATQANGHRIETIEGIRKKEEFEDIERAFIAKGALQCGYCTPAFVLYAYYILNKSKSENKSNKKKEKTRDEIRKEVSGVYCRCGSYQKVIDAIEALLRGEEIDLLPEGSDVVGKGVERKDYREKIEGRAIYAYDLKSMIKGRGVLYLKFLRCPYAFARIKRIDTSKVRGAELILTCENVPQIYFTTAGQSYPEASPYDTKVLNNPVRYVGEPVAIVAANSEELAEEALKDISVEYEVMKPILDPEKSLKLNDEIKIHPESNVVGEMHEVVGDPDEGFKEAEVILEREYEVQMQKHIHLEPYASFSYWDKNTLVVETGSQVVYHCRRTISRILNLPENRIRVLSHTMGGGFGDRQEMTLEHYVSLVAYLTGKPCFASLTREEQFFLSRRRHRAKIRIKLGAKRDGKLTAMSMEALSDTGAYGSHGVTVTTNMGSMTLPLYTKHCKNIGFDATIVYTNTPIAGAFRGYGTVQGGFALESAMDELAESLSMDPIDLRLENVIEGGAIDPLSEVLSEGGEAIPRKIESCGIEEALRKGRELFNWDGKKKEAIGVACGMKGSGVAGFEFANATARLNEDGTITVSIGAADIGQGAESAMAQIAAQASGISFKDIKVISADTERSPFDMGTYASSVTYVTGMAVKRAAEDLREKILKRVERTYGRKAKLKDSMLEDKPIKEFAMDCFYGNDKEELCGKGSAIDLTSPPPFTAHFVELDVNKATGEVRIKRYLAMSDIGAVINPIAAEGQIQGGILQGTGYALFEDMLFDEEGKLLNPNLTNYKIPSALDAPDIESHFIESNEPSGPFGAKSCGEIAFVPVAPAIANAIYKATGIRFRKLPITRERMAMS
ncbi:MAG: molybdopterin cofactor-binding domain-containing protein [Candidatus Thermoplasmatota archaeon]|nr:molybdopterin cofactor-binding domain-containing protein [Candidatus Thermoplasmatota archaeon]